MRDVRKAPGFTLIELLIVIAIIGFLASAVLVAVDPVKRIQDSRNAQRWSEVNAILNAILKYQVDNRTLFTGGDGNGNGNVIVSSSNDAQLIIDNSGSSTKDVTTVVCDGSTNSDWSTACPGANTEGYTMNTDNNGSCMADLGKLVPDYLASVPTDPGTNHVGTGYYIQRNTGTRITIGACDPEQNATISVRR